MGFIIDSKKWLNIYQVKKKLYEKYYIIPTKPKFTIRELASFIGTLLSLFPRNQFGLLNYRTMLKFKVNFNAIIRLAEGFIKYHGSDKNF